MKITPVSAKIIIISVASNLSFFTFNTKNNTNILHINIIYQPVEYYYFSKKRIIWMQGARHGFINGKQDVKATEKHSGVHHFVNFGLLFWVVWDAVANGPLTIYCLTGLLFTQSGWMYRKFCSPAWLALTHSVCVCMCVYVCRAWVPTVQFAHVLKGVVFRAQMLFNRLHF